MEKQGSHLLFHITRRRSQLLVNVVITLSTKITTDMCSIKSDLHKGKQSFSIRMVFGHDGISIKKIQLI